ncbi:MAG: hypothetical protein IPK21_12485 [Haliscomenobacter sp.]|nr:hypothetical protein [Haliscomenobacter sp.]
MKKISVFTVSLLLLTLALSCQNKKNAQTPADGEASAASDTDYGVFAEDGDSLLIPTFEIEVSNSVKTNQMLTKQKETVLVLAYFFGEPKDEKDMDEVGQLQIINKEVELTGDARIARFSGIKFSKQVYEKLADKDLRVLINVVSGRRSSDDNLLDCGLMDLKASQFMDKRFLIGCKLIEEPAQAGAGMESNSGYPIACYALPPAGEAPCSPTQLPGFLLRNRRYGVGGTTYGRSGGSEGRYPPRAGRYGQERRQGTPRHRNARLHDGRQRRDPGYVRGAEGRGGKTLGGGWWLVVGGWWLVVGGWRWKGLGEAQRL